MDTEDAVAVLERAESIDRAALARRVERGMAVLDERRWGWWRTDRTLWPVINLDELDLSDDQHCVLGQLGRDRPDGYSSYFGMRAQLGLSQAAAIAGGFEAGRADCDTHSCTCRCWTTYPVLTEIWREHITARRNAG